MKLRHYLYFGSALFAAANTANGNTYYWDSDNNTTGFGNTSGTWSATTNGTTTRGWTTAPTGNTVVNGNSVTTTTSDTVNFGTAANSYGSNTTAKVITVSGIVDVGTIVFGNATASRRVDLTGGTLNFAAAGSISNNSANSNYITSAITGAGTSLTFDGTASNAVIMDAALGASSRLIDIKSGARLDFNVNQANTSGMKFKVDGNLNLRTGQAGAYSGQVVTAIDLGELNGAGTIGRGGAAGGAAILNIGALNTDSSFSGAIGSAEIGVNKTGSGKLTLSGANNFSGATTISAGTLVLANTAALQNTNNITLANTGTTLRFATDTAFTSLANITGSSGSNAATIVSDRATTGDGITHVLGTATLGANSFNFTSGTNVTGGTAGITLSAVSMTSGTSGTTVLNPTTATLTITGGVTSQTNNFARTLELGGNGTGHSIGGVITQSVASPLSLTKSNTSTWTLHGANTYTGLTTISGGTLALGATGSITETSGVNLTTSTAKFNVTTANFTLGATQTLSGIGTVENTGRTLTANGTLAPGNSPGTLTVDGGTMALGTGGAYSFQILDATGAAGAGYDTVSLVNGATLDLSSLTTSSYTINLSSLLSTGPDVAGDASNFNNTLGYAWTLFSTGSAISNFDAADFTINTGGFSNALGGGSFSVGLADGNTDLVLNFTPVPEPRAVLLGGFGILALLRRRR